MDLPQTSPGGVNSLLSTDRTKKKASILSPFTIEHWPIERPIPFANNPRKLSAVAVDKVAASLREFGWRQPIVVDRKDVVIAGHTRLLAAKQLQLTKVPVHVATNLSAAQVKAYRLMDNRSHQESDWDLELLGPELADLKLLNFDLALTGFDPGELTKFTTAGGLTDEDEVPEPPAEPVTVLGDLWLLGRHRLLCGDATDRAAVERLMDGRKADMLFTDPPYGISVVRTGRIGGDKPFGKNGSDSIVKAGVYPPIMGDDSIETALAAYAVCDGIGVPLMLLWGGNFFAHRLPPVRCWVVWDKETDGNFGDGEIAWCNAQKSIRIFRHKWSGMLKASEKGESRVHPTQKPVALAVWAFAEFSPSSVIVLDLFLGSGSTLIACETTNRTCFGTELTAAYCDVIVNRWQNYTGKEATLNGDTRTFAAIAKARAKRANPAA
jgi:hypothetical protein